jgi:hypothetical protein
VPAQPIEGPLHVGRDDRDVLEPRIVAARVDGDRPAPGRQDLHQLDELVAKPHADDPHAQAEQAHEVLVGLARHLDVRDLLEGEDVLVEVERAVRIADGDGHRIDGADGAVRRERSRACGEGDDKQAEERQGERQDAKRRAVPSHHAISRARSPDRTVSAASRSPSRRPQA